MRPSGQPTGQPSSRPSTQPSGQPTVQPSSQPTGQPTGQPLSQPTGQPSSQPTGQPTGQPAGQPSSQPSGQPTGQPTMRPSGQPSSQPTSQTTGQPSSQPTVQPTSQPSSNPSTSFSPLPTYLISSRPSSIICIQNDSFRDYLNSVRPNITYIDQSRFGDAAGNEMISLYGRHLGLNTSVLGVVINDLLAWKVCTFPVWRKSFNLVPSHGRVNRLIPSVQCITAATTVGWKNVTLFSDGFISLPYTRYQVTCKAGSFGGVGEMCSSCNDLTANASAVSGMLCPYDNMENPIAAPGDGRVRITVSTLSSPVCLENPPHQHSGHSSHCPIPSLHCNQAGSFYLMKLPPQSVSQQGLREAYVRTFHCALLFHLVWGVISAA